MASESQANESFRNVFEYLDSRLFTSCSSLGSERLKIRLCFQSKAQKRRYVSIKPDGFEVGTPSTFLYQCLDLQSWALSLTVQ